MDGYDWQMLLFGDAAAEVMRVICRCEEGHYHVRTADYVVMVGLCIAGLLIRVLSPVIGC